MDFINEILFKIAEEGRCNEIYGIINSISLYIALILGFLNGIKLKAGIIASLAAVAGYYYLSGPIASAIVYIEDGFRVSGRANGVYAFAFMPLIGFLVSIIVRKSYKVIWDVIMVIPLMMFAGARVACTVAGCCKGYPFEWGVYNQVLDTNTFPVQLLESIISIIILAYIFWREKKNNFVPDGKNLPIILIFYGIARFLTEFLHYDYKFLGIFTWMQVHCVIIITVGLITWKIVKKSEKKDSPCSE